MHENCDFIFPINMLTPFGCTPFSWAAQHTTVCLDVRPKLTAADDHLTELIFNDLNTMIDFSVSCYPQRSKLASQIFEQSG